MGSALNFTNISGIAPATTTSRGVAEVATSAEVTTGTDNERIISPDALAGSDFGKTVVTILVTDPNGDTLTTGDGKAYWRGPSTINGYNLVDVASAVTTASSSGTPEVQIHNVTKAVDMLSTTLTIDINELDSKDDSDSLPVINTANDNVTTGDQIRIDIDTAGTGAKGLMVEMHFQMPA